MSIKLYDENFVSIDDLGGVVQSAHNGVTGEIVDILLYLKNDSASVYYTDLFITPIDGDVIDDTLGVYGTGRGIKLVAGSREPNEPEWENVLAGDFIEMSEVGTTSSADITTFFPFWMRVIVPGNTEIQTFTDLSLNLTAVEHPVGS